jgi:probable phosphoglycerate mutase
VATILLIRHATTDAVGRRLVGRMAGVSLNEEGRREAERLARRLAHSRLDAVYSSPIERARETAEPLARAGGLAVRVREAFTEFDFGEWSGATFEALAATPGWDTFNGYRAGARPPGGETSLEVMARVVGELERLALEHGDGRIAVVSHGDPIKLPLAHYLGVPVEIAHRIEISPASVSVLELSRSHARLLRLNDTGDPF